MNEITIQIEIEKLIKRNDNRQRNWHFFLSLCQLIERDMDKEQVGINEMLQKVLLNLKLLIYKEEAYFIAIFVNKCVIYYFYICMKREVRFTTEGEYMKLHTFSLLKHLKYISRQ